MFDALVSLGSAYVGSLDAHAVLPRLWIGALPPDGRVVRDAGVDVLVLCSRQHQDGRYEGVEVIKCPLDDAPLTQPQWFRAVACAREVVRRLQGGRRVFVTCRMGLNRSALVTTLALHMLTGWSGKACVMNVRLARPGALFNRSFVQALEAL